MWGAERKAVQAAFDVIVVGGGLVGAAIAYGLARQHRARTLLLDEGDIALRASRGNFGLVWVQGKGRGFPAYTRWTMASADAWPAFSEEIEDATGIDADYDRPGGVDLAFDAAELHDLATGMHDIRSGLNGRDYPFDVLDQRGLKNIFPHVGDGVAGGIHCPHDGVANPLRLLQALHAGFARSGGTYVARCPVASVQPQPSGVRVRTGQGDYSGATLVLAAGLGTTGLAAQAGMTVPLHPNRGQLMVTEPMPAMLGLPTVNVRQTREGSFLIGYTSEDAGLPTETTQAGLGAIARRAVTAFPFLAGVRIVRTWAALRIMSPDGFPIYARAPDHPHIVAAACHSGVTLAAMHASRLPDWIVGAEDAPDLSAFSSERFDVPTAA